MYDGHGGCQVSELLAKMLGDKITGDVDRLKLEPAETITEAFREVDEVAVRKSRELSEESGVREVVGESRGGVDGDYRRCVLMGKGVFRKRRRFKSDCSQRRRKRRRRRS